MREIRSYGSVGVPAGNRRHYPAKSASRTGPRAVPAHSGPCGFRAPWRSAHSGGFLRAARRPGASPVLPRCYYGESTVYLPC